MARKNKEELLSLIRKCRVYRYSTKETLEFLENHGHKISDRTLRRLKQDMTENIDDQFTHMIRHEFFDLFMHTIDSYKIVENRLWKILESNPSTNEQIRALNSICNVLERTSEYVNETPNIKKLKEILDSRFSKLQQMQSKLNDGLCN